jgi:hypothetical protein
VKLKLQIIGVNTRLRAKQDEWNAINAMRNLETTYSKLSTRRLEQGASVDKVFIKKGQVVDDAGKITFERIDLNGVDTSSTSTNDQNLTASVVFKVKGKGGVISDEIREMPVSFIYDKNLLRYRCRSPEAMLSNQDFRSAACTSMGAVYNSSKKQCEFDNNATYGGTFAQRLECMEYCKDTALSYDNGKPFSTTFGSGASEYKCQCTGAKACTCAIDHSKVLLGFVYNDTCGEPMCSGSYDKCAENNESDKHTVGKLFQITNTANGLNEVQNCIGTRQPCNCNDAGNYAIGTTYTTDCGTSCTGTKCTPSTTVAKLVGTAYYGSQTGESEGLGPASPGSVTVYKIKYNYRKADCTYQAVCSENITRTTGESYKITGAMFGVTEDRDASGQSEAGAKVSLALVPWHTRESNNPSSLLSGSQHSIKIEKA